MVSMHSHAYCLIDGGEKLISLLLIHMINSDNIRSGFLILALPGLCVALLCFPRLDN